MEVSLKCCSGAGETAQLAEGAYRETWKSQFESQDPHRARKTNSDLVICAEACGLCHMHVHMQSAHVQNNKM